MTLDEINKKIQVLKGKSYKEHSIENYDEYLGLAREILFGQRSTLISPYYIQSVFRARKSESEKVFHNLGEVWYPPIFDVKAQRLNFPYKPIFYCSNDITTALIEVSPQRNDFITMIEIHLTSKEFNCIQLAPEKFGDALDKMDPVKRAAFNFIVSEIRKIVPDGQFQEYYATQIYAQGLTESLDPHTWDSIAYNSVAASHKGYNFAIKTDFIDNNFIFASAKLFKVVDFISREKFTVRCLLEADTISSFGRINFQKIKHCPTHEISLNNYQD